MESYRVPIKASAAKELEALPIKKIRQRVAARIRALAGDPRPAGCEKLAGYLNRYRIRQGAYRAIYSVSDEERLVLIVKIGQRRGAHSS